MGRRVNTQGPKGPFLIVNKESNMTVGIVVARFQGGPHLGHCDVLSRASEECDEGVHVLIASSDRSKDFHSPFTVKYRRELIKSLGIPNLELHDLPDFPTNSEWIAEIIGMVHNLTEDKDPADINMYFGAKDEVFYRKHFLYNMVPCDMVFFNGIEISGTIVRESLYRNTPLSVQCLAVTTHARITNTVNSPEFTELRKEYFYVSRDKATKTLAHPYNNAIEPVAHACVIKDGNILMLKRNTPRGYGQWALPGGYVEHTESTKDAALRELREEAGIDLEAIDNVVQMAVCVEENLDDIGVRTLGVNYLFAIKEDVEVTLDHEEVSDYAWIPFAEVAEGTREIFYNHRLVVKRLLSSIPE